MKTLKPGKRSLILLALLPGLYVSDIFYGWLYLMGYGSVPVTPGVVIRGGLLLGSIAAAIKYQRYIDRQIRFFCWTLLVLSFAGPALGFVSSMSIGNAVMDARSVSKVIYGPFLMMLFMILVRKYGITYDDVFRHMEYVFYFLGISVFLMQTAGFGGATYGDYAYGSKGVFKAQNEISLSLAISMVAAVYRTFKAPRILRLLAFAVASAGFVGIGTRSSLISVLAVPVMVVALLLFTRKSGGHGKQRRIITGLMSATLIIAAAGGFGYVALKKTLQHGYQAKKFETLASGELPRALLIASGIKYLETRSTIYHVFGEGDSRYAGGVYKYWPGFSDDERKLAEVGWLDIFGAYGIIFLILIYGFYLFMWTYSIKQFLASRRQAAYGLTFVMLSLYLGHSVLAGHALVSPIVSTLISVTISVFWVSLRQRDSGRVLISLPDTGRANFSRAVTQITLVEQKRV